MSGWRKRTIVEMAREAGFEQVGHDSFQELTARMEAFAKLVLMNTDPKSFMSWQEGYEAGKLAEREACAKVCEENATDLTEGDWDSACNNCADHIRDRGQA